MKQSFRSYLITCYYFYADFFESLDHKALIIRVNRLGRIFYYESFKAFLSCIFGGIADAEIKC